ncbi:5-methyltetrahydropteroyltriglutamate--homocysteine S-methyltransferase [Leptospira ilyithenensis]|uniref:5-methyltetrahydropteroyltriglutamate--homocysteine methyltransferase n=1 Tax=Leptospira ilyithenensis TaxID=2484901 RepID=A0A4R9LVE1_9LEPT|nr:5-methyltetrahydropteroyltriglutamate--homocysteine S-methyltransferase [Leptospira ilyithenensis]TGN11869.1 5-methyltetrahydropteroyltriglutamate--homocysteine S-methyltransferase [Leptospira ilyithenensis]
MSVLATCLGYPRFGKARELKKSLESFWAGKISEEELNETGKNIRKQHWLEMKRAGMNHIPSNDFSYYDHVLDTIVLLGATPKRYGSISNPIARYFAMARGLQNKSAGIDTSALEMTKWFDTNYHYIVPELNDETKFSLNPKKLISEWEEAYELGIETRPVILGPVSFLLLSKMDLNSKKSPLHFLKDLLPLYKELFSLLKKKGVRWIQLDEPCLVLELEKGIQSSYQNALTEIAKFSERPKILVTTYFGDLKENLKIATASKLDGLHIDLVRAPEQLETVLASLPPEYILSLGLVDGRNIWRTDLEATHKILRTAVEAIGSERIFVGSSSSLLHVPEDLNGENQLDTELKSWLSFALQKLSEIKALAEASGKEVPSQTYLVSGYMWLENKKALKTRKNSPRTKNQKVRERLEKISEGDKKRKSTFINRQTLQQKRFSLPTFPTTTIGSFPQTNDVRSARASWKSGKLSLENYNRFLKEETKQCIAKQESIGLDVLVHGEFERTDMVEYFGEKLEGFAFTENGWVQSYGSRCVKPPILFGDIFRPEPMTVDWAIYSQSLTPKIVKGMLTGPVTILQWSFVRNDQPRQATCEQIALSLRDEVNDLESAGIQMIQVDEPAIREGLPLRKSEWKTYLKWAVDSFRLATSGVKDETQIHTHMCYSEFGEILESIEAMDADVLSIETSRSQMELFRDFGKSGYKNEIGPGVYDIHSPRVPSKEEMIDLLEKAKSVLPYPQLWVNPDCGLKTRGWPEVEEALRNMVEAAEIMRTKTEEYAK